MDFNGESSRVTRSKSLVDGASNSVHEEEHQANRGNHSIISLLQHIERQQHNMNQRLEAIEEGQRGAADATKALSKRVDDLMLNMKGVVNHHKIYPGTAGASVAGIFELLEAILALLPLRDILLAQRVNCQFRDVVANSEKLQRMLFFTTGQSKDKTATEKPMINPLFTETGLCKN